MKTHRWTTRVALHFCVAMLVLAVTSPPTTARAAVLTWGAAGGGGTGNWDTTTASWYDGASAVQWSNANPDSAVFAGTAGTVTLTEAITTGGLTFSTAGYTVTSGTLSLASATGTAAVIANANATISSILAGSNVLSKSGAGTLTLSSANTYSGGTLVTAGRIVLSNNAALGSGTVTLDGGSIERNSAGATVTNAIAVGSGGGTIVGDTAISNYVTFSGLLSGAGPLTAQGLVTINNTSNTYSGTLSISNASATYFRLAASEVLGDTAVVSLGGGNSYFRLDGGVTETIGGLNAASGGNVFVGSAGTARLKVASGTASSIFGKLGGGATQILVLEKVGSGTLTLNRSGGNNGEAIGGVEVSGGTLRLAAASRDFSNQGYFPGSQALSARTGGTLEIGSDWNSAPTNVYTIDAATLRLTAGTSDDSVNYVNNLTLQNGGTLAGNGVRIGYFGNATITAGGSSASAITANLRLTRDSANPSYTTTLNVADVTSSAAADLVVSGTIVDNTGFGGMPLVKSGSGTLSLTVANTYTGSTTISQGAIVISNASGLGTTGAITLNNASTGTINTGLLLDVSGGNVTFSRPITVASQGTGTSTIGVFASASTRTATFSGAISLQQRDVTLFGAGGGDRNDFTGGISGTGNVTITTSGGGRILFSGVTANTYTGTTTITAGSTLQFSDGSSQTTNYLPDTTVLVANGTLNLARGANSETIAGLSGSGTVQGHPGVGSIASAILVDGGQSQVFSGVLGNGGASGATLSFTKAGSGTQTLAGSNSYTGNTLVRAGTLIGANSNAFGTGGTITINDASTGSSNASLLIDATSATVNIGRAITVANQGTGTTTIGSTANAGGNFATFSGAITLAKDVTLTGVATGDRTQFTGGIGGTGNVTVTTAAGGRIIFQDVANTYAGSTTITAGSRLQLGTGGSTTVSLLPDGQPVTVTGTLSLAKGGNSETIDALLGAGTVAGISADTLVVGSAGGSGTFAGVLQNAGSALAFSKSGAGTQSLTGTNTYTGATTISGGTLAIGGSGVLGGGSYAGTITNNAALAIATSASQTLSGNMSGSGRLVKSGGGTLTLSGSNSFSGGSTLAGGLISLASTDALGTTGTISFTGGTLQFAAANTTDYSGRFSTDPGQAFSLDTNGQSVTLATALTSVGATLAKLGSGTLTLTANNTYSGATTVSAGVLQVGNGGATGAVAGDIANAGTVVFNRSGALSVGGAISGTGSLRQAGSGTTTLSGANSYAGPTTITGGVLSVSQDANLGAVPGSATPGSLVVNGGGLAITTGFTLSSNRGIALGPASGGGTGTIDVAGGQTVNYAGTIANNGGGTGGLVKAGGGILAITGNHTYTGTTSVNAGTLQVTSGSLASTAVVVAGGATLSGAGTLAATTVGDPGILTPGVVTPGVGGIGTLTLSSLTFTGSATVNVGVQNNATSSLLQVNGNVTTAGANTVTFAFGGNLASINSGTYTLLSYTGTQLADVSAFLVSGGTGGRQSVTLVNATQAVNLEIGNAFPIWSGTDGSGWSTADNWVLSSNDSPTSFLTNDTVVFNDAGDTGNVTLSQNVNPATTTFSGTTLAYTISSTGGFGITTGNLVKTGPATLTISTSNSYSGGSTLSAGTIRVGNDAALGTGALTVSGSAAGMTLSSDGATPRALANGLHLDGDVTLGNATDNGALTITGTVTFDGSTRTITTPSNVTLSGVVTNGGFTKAGAGVLTVTGSNDYAGGTTLSAGTLRVGGNAALGAGGISLNGGTLSSDSTTARTLANAVTIGGDVTLGDATNNGTLTLGTGGVSLGSGTRQVTTASDVTFAGAVTSGGLTKAGPGTLTLSAANSYADGTTLSAGDVTLGNVAGLGTGTTTYAGAGTIRNTVGGTIANPIVVNAGVAAGFDSAANATTLSGAIANAGTLTLTTSATQTLSGALSGTGSLVKAGTGRAVLTAASVYTGDTTISAGTLEIAGAGQLGGGTYAGAIANAGTLAVTTSANQALSGVVSGVGSLTKSGGGTLTLSNASNSYSGGSTVTGGTVAFASGALGSTGNVTLSNAALRWDTGNTQDLSSRLVLQNSTTAALDVGGNDVAFASGFGGSTSAALVKLGSGKLTIAGTATYTGDTTISVGTLEIAGAGQLGGGTYAGAIANAGTLAVASSANQTLSGVISGVGAVTKSGAGTLTLSNASNTYSGQLTIAQGTVSVATANNVSSNGPLGNSALGVILGSSGNVGTLAYTGATATTTKAFTLASGGTGGFDVTTGSTLTVNSVIDGSGRLAKSGAGVLVIAGANTFSNGATVSAGTLRLGSSTALPNNAAVTVASGATFDYAGFPSSDNTRNFAFTISGSGVGGAGAITNSSGSDIYSFSSIGSLVLAADSAVGGSGGRFDIGNGNAGPTVDGGGFTLTKVGSNNVVFRPETVTNLPGIRVAAGTLQFEAFNRTTPATASMVTTILSGATVTTFGNLTQNMPLVFEGGSALTNSNGSATWTGAVTVNAGTSTVNTGLPITLSGPISGVGSLTKSGAGTLTISSTSNSFSGNATISGGVLSFANGALGTGTAVMNGGTLQWASGNTDGTVRIGLVNAVTATLDTNGNNVNLTNGFGAGTSGSVTKAGAGALTMSGSYGFTGNLNATSGTLGLAGTLSGVSRLSVTTATLAMSGGTTSATTVITSDASATVSVVNQTGGTLNVLGTDNSNTTTASLLLGHWGGGAATTWSMSGGTLNSTGAMMSLGWDATTTVNQSGGTANLLGINLANSRNSSATYNLTGGRLNIGSSGITANASKTVNLGSGTVGALANWSTSQNLPLTSAAPGVAFDPSGFTITLSGTLTGSGALNVLGTGTVALAANNTYAGTTTVSSGVLALSGAGSIGSSSGVNLSGSGATFDISAASGNRTIGALAGAAGSSIVLGSNGLTAGDGSTTTFAGSMSGVGGFTKTGSGTLTLSGSSTHSGGSTVAAGVLEFTSGGLGSGTATVNAATLRWATGNTQDVSASGLALVDATTATLDVGSNNVTLGSGFGAGSTADVTKVGAGTLTLSGSNGYTGDTTVSEGTLAIAGGGSVASSGAMVIASGAVLDIAGSSGVVTVGALAGVGTVTLGGNTLRTNAVGESLEFGGVISGAGGFTKAGPDRLLLTGSQAFTGTATVEQGILQLGSGNVGALASASRIFIASGAFLDTDSQTLSIVTNQTLGGYGTVEGAVTLDPGSIVSPGGSIGNLTVNGGFTFSGTSGYQFEITNAVTGTTPGTDWDLLTATSLTILSTPENPFRILLTSLTSGTSLNPGSMGGNWDPNSNYQWRFVTTQNQISPFDPAAFTIDQSDFDPYNATNGGFSVVRGDSIGQSDTDLYIIYAAVPEPGTLALAGIALAAAGLAARRRRRS